MTRAKVLVTGGSGQVGTALARAASAGALDLLLPPRADFDLGLEASMDAWFGRNAVDAVINAGAYTAVDRAEEDAAAAWAINAAGPGWLASRCAELEIPLVHLSTDYVFDGSKDGFYVEDDAVAPVGEPIWSSTTRSSERSAPSRSIVLAKLAPHGLITQAVLTIRCRGQMERTFCSPASLEAP